MAPTIFRVRSISIGFSNNWYLSEAFGLRDRSAFLDRFDFGPEVKVGLGYSRGISELVHPVNSFEGE